MTDNHSRRAEAPVSNAALIMGKPSESHLDSAILILATLALSFSGFAGLAEGAPRTLLIAGAGFWLLMLLVPWMFLSSRMASQSVRAAVAAAFGTLVGTCVYLGSATGEGWLGLLLYGSAGGAIGFVTDWARYLRRKFIWGDIHSR